MKTYSSKSNAKRAFVKTGQDEALFNLVQQDDGKWGYEEVAEIVAEEIVKPSVSSLPENPTFDDVLRAIGTSAPTQPAVPKGHSKKPVEHVVGEFDNCPNCGLHLDNGFDTTDNMVDDHDPKRVQYGKEQKLEFLCLGCGEDFGPVNPHLSTIGKGIKIEKNRVEQNGVVRPSVGGKCRAIWDACDALLADGDTPMPKVIKALATENGWNLNNAVIEMYQWRKFNGIVGRQTAK